MKTRTVQTLEGRIKTPSAQRREGPLYGIFTFLKREHKSALMTESDAPVSTSASVRIPSTYTNNIFDGRSGGVSYCAKDAAFPPEAALFSFPVDDQESK